MSMLSDGDIAAMNRTMDDLYATPLQEMHGLPIINATLLQVAGGGFSEDYDQPPTSSTATWTGAEAAYLAQETIMASSSDRQSSAQGVDEVVRTRLSFDAELAAVRPGDALTFEYDGVTATRKARDVAIDEIVGNVTVTFEDA